MRKKIIIILLVIFALIACRWLISFISKGSMSKQRMAMATPAVTVDIVKVSEARRAYESPARVVAKYRVEVLARISGYLTKSYFKEGDFVKAGQVLFEIEPQEYSYAANRAKANLDNVKSQYNYYEKQLARYKELVDHDYVARSDYDNVLAQRDAYRAQVANADSAYRDAQRNYGYTKVKSPVDGKVGIIDVTVGNFVSIQSPPLTTINSANPMYVTFPMEAKDYAELVRIDGYGNENREVDFIFSNGQRYKFKGVQDFHDNKVDETTGTITMRATFPNPDDILIQGDFGRVKIYSNKNDKLPIVPQSATMENQEGLYVYIMDEQNLPKLSYIKTMGQVDSNWIVTDGVKEGDRIITTGLQKVIPGNKVKIVEKVSDSTKVKVKQSVVSKVLTKIRKIIAGGNK